VDGRVSKTRRCVPDVHVCSPSSGGRFACESWPIMDFLRQRRHERRRRQITFRMTPADDAGSWTVDRQQSSLP
jgi:hypothetical protein